MMVLPSPERPAWVCWVAMLLCGLALLAQPRRSDGGTIVLLKGQTLTSDRLAPLIWLPGGELLSSTDLIAKAWRVPFQDDDVLGQAVPGGAVFRYSDLAPQPIDSFASAAAAELFLYDPAQHTFVPFSQQPLLLSQALSQPGALAAIDARALSLPSWALSSDRRARPLAPAIDLGVAVGPPGGRACLSATLFNRDARVAAAFSIFGSSQLSIHECRISPAIGSGTSADKQLRTTHGAHLALLEIVGNSNLIPSGLLYTCTLDIDPSTAVGRYDLASIAGANDPSDAIISNTTSGPGQLVVTSCAGDCNGNGVVSIGETQRCVNGLLGAAACDGADPRRNCPVADANGDGSVSLSEVQRCVNHLLAGC